MKIKFKEWNCILKKEMYQNNQRVALVLEDENDGEVVAHATVNLSKYPLDDNEVLIKDYAENEGMLDCLIEHGIVEKPEYFIYSGFVQLPVCKLLI